ncbi:MAG: ABC transporter ATP-binding protein [Aggregatilineales bacterium]
MSDDYFEDDDQQYSSFDWDVSKRFWGYLRPERKKIYGALFASLFSVVSSVLGPPIIGYAVDEGIQNRDLTIVGVGVAAYLVTQLIGAIGFRYQIFWMAEAGQRAIQKLRDDLFEHIQVLSISFFTKYETGRLIARVISDVDTLRQAITFAVVGSFRDFLILVGIVISMMIINLPLTAVAFGALVALIVVANYWRIYARASYLRVVETNAKVNAELSESFNGVRVTKAYDREAYNYNRFTSHFNMNHRQSNVRASLIASLFFPSIELIGGVATGLLIYVGGTLVLNEQLSVFTLLTFVLYIDQFFAPIRQLAQRYNMLQSVMAAGHKIFWLLDAPVEVRDETDAVRLPTISGHVKFENVRFAYDDGEEVLRDINLDIPAGTSVAFVGHTGAGKTTMIKLIQRLYDITEGKLTIDGYDLHKISQNSLRGQFGVVLQEPHLFSGTVMENIRYGRLDATDDEVIKAATDVGAHDFILRLENGYETEVREGGSLLSAGQKQLISFARALLADPRLLILDEATSNIDTQTEKIIQDALEILLKGRTSFVIAHRLSTITSSNLIVVMDHGRIVEKGTHEELLALGGMYTSMYTMTDAFVD